MKVQELEAALARSNAIAPRTMPPCSMAIHVLPRRRVTSGTGRHLLEEPTLGRAVLLAQGPQIGAR